MVMEKNRHTQKHDTQTHLPYSSPYREIYQMIDIPENTAISVIDTTKKNNFFCILLASHSNQRFLLVHTAKNMSSGALHLIPYSMKIAAKPQIDLSCCVVDVRNGHFVVKMQKQNEFLCFFFLLFVGFFYFSLILILYLTEYIRNHALQQYSRYRRR